MKKWTMCVCHGLLVTLVALSAQAQEVEPTEREKELTNRVEELEKRVWQLESELRETKAAPPKVPAELTSRVEDVEKKVAVGLEKVGAVEEKVGKIEPKEEKPDTFRVFWKQGLNLATPDSAFKLKIGGRIMTDWAWLSGDDELEDEVGEQGHFTVGLNWYLNPNTRIMWNYVHADVDGVGDGDAFQMRAQIDF